MQTFKKLLAAIIVIAIIYFGLWPFMYAGDRMETFCRQVPMGMAQTEFYRHVKEQSKYKIVESKENNMFRVLIVDAKTMGRYICEVTLEEGKTAKAKYIFND
jgi:hypothetical protein